jgi:hypothetical protein
MKKLFLLIFAFSCLSANFQQIPQLNETDTASIIKASYLYNFSKLVDWPAEYKTGNFVISVMGGSNLHKELVEQYNTKQIGSQQLEIRKLSKTLNISSCHVLYVGPECTDILPEISEALKDQPTLIVSDAKGALQRGSALNFVVDGTQLKFELNESNASKRDLFVGSTLKSLAIESK